MITFRLVLLMALAAFTASAQHTSSQQATFQPGSVPASCRVTPRPATAFIPPSDYHFGNLSPDAFLIGTEKLWTSLSEPMVWKWRPHQPGHEQDLTAKLFWFRVGYSWRTEPIPKIKVTGRRLDGPASALMLPQGPATHAIMDNSGKGAILTGVYVPTPGCWEITGDYEGDKVSFVAWVEPFKQTSQ
ncbi:MAG TPA: hypothetical protein VE133_02080 [Candidatus Sulfotelmatobacter sp.]|jgi:hypothetical protein|nr:hypothetical protein [Candidatus Sulfotelmatobacter sp.]